MSWYCFQVSREGQAEVVAENLRMLAVDPVSRPLLGPDVHVYRRRAAGAEIFYFSPAAYRFFQPFIATYGGKACDRPVATHDQPELLRLSLRAARAWQPIPPGEAAREDGDFPH